MTAQVTLLLSTLKENNWEQQAGVIRQVGCPFKPLWLFILSFSRNANRVVLQLLESNSMEVFHKFFRRLVTSHAHTIFSPISKQPDNPSSYRLLAQHVKEIANSPEDSKAKFADCITSSDNDPFRDFDLHVFMRHFDLDGLERTILALGFASSPRVDLSSKGKQLIICIRSLSINIANTRISV